MTKQYTIENSGLHDRIYLGYECVAEVVSMPIAETLVKRANLNDELLESVRELYAALREYTDEGETKLQAAILERAEAAIAKATGETDAATS